MGQHPRLRPSAWRLNRAPDFPDSPTRGNQEIVIRQGHLGRVLDISTYRRTGEDTYRPCSANRSTETLNTTLDRPVLTGAWTAAASRSGERRPNPR